MEAEFIFESFVDHEIDSWFKGKLEDRLPTDPRGMQEELDKRDGDKCFPLVSSTERMKEALNCDPESDTRPLLPGMLASLGVTDKLVGQEKIKWERIETKFLQGFFQFCGKPASSVGITGQITHARFPAFELDEGAILTEACLKYLFLWEDSNLLERLIRAVTARTNIDSWFGKPTLAYSNDDTLEDGDKTSKESYAVAKGLANGNRDKFVKGPISGPESGTKRISWQLQEPGLYKPVVVEFNSDRILQRLARDNNALMTCEEIQQQFR